jgi:hypothetical protein
MWQDEKFREPTGFFVAHGSPLVGYDLSQFFRLELRLARGRYLGNLRHWTHPMHMSDTSSANAGPRVEPISFAKASLGFVMSTIAVSSLMVLLGSL